MSTNLIKRESGYAWVMVALGALFIAVSNGSINTIAIFMAPVTHEMGWLRGEASLAYTFATISFGLNSILAGHLSDRFGPRPLVLVGAVAVGTSLFMMGRVTGLWEYYLLQLVFGGFGCAAIQIPLLSTVTNWFRYSPGTAVGLMNVGRTIGNGFVPFFAGAMVASYDWRQAYAILGVSALVILLPLVLLVRRAPNLKSDAETIAAAAAKFLPTGKVMSWIGSAAIFCCIAHAIPLLHVVSMARDKGIAPQQAASILTVWMIFGLVGAVLAGRMGDKIGMARVYLIGSIFQTVMVIWFLFAESYGGFLVIAALFGMGFGGVMTGLIASSQVLVRPDHRGFSGGIGSACGWSGMGVGGFLGGLLFDIAGDYTLAFMVATAAGLVNVTLLIFFQGAYKRGVEGIAEQSA